MPAIDAVGSIAHVLESVPQVERVYVFPESEGAFSIVTVIDADDDDVYDQIFDRERQLIHSLPCHHLAFKVIARRGRPIDEFVGSSTPVWQR